MKHELATKRLHLRPICLDDIHDLHRFWTLPEVRKYLWDDLIVAQETVAEIIARSEADFLQFGFGHWLATSIEQKQMVGWVGLRNFGEPPEVELLYGISPEFWGQGLACEAAETILAYGFLQLGLDCINAGTDPPNKASMRVMEKIGMEFHRNTKINNLDAVYYRLRRADYLSKL